MGILEALSNMSTLALIIFIAGMVLIAVEMFSPGFGVAGGIGVLLLFVGVVMTAKTVAQGFIMGAVVLVILAVMLAILLRSASKGRLSRSLILKDRTDAASGFSGTEDQGALVGRTGKALTVLRPAGIADIDGVRLDVVTQGEFLNPGAAVEVVEVEGNRIVVRAAGQT